MKGNPALWSEPSPHQGLPPTPPGALSWPLPMCLETLQTGVNPVCSALGQQMRTPNFDSEVLSHHAVASSQVTVDKLVGVEVCHAVGNLSCHLDHLAQAGGGNCRVVLWRVGKRKEVG